MVMLKDNHLWTHGNIAKCVERAKTAAGFTTMIEVECRDLAEARVAAGAGAHICMLDNFTPEDCKAAAKALKDEFPVSEEVNAYVLFAFKDTCAHFTPRCSSCALCVSLSPSVSLLSLAHTHMRST